MREIDCLGHETNPVDARNVRLYARTQKNEFNDAKAIAEAVSRRHMRSAKAIEHQAILHRCR